MLRKEVEDVLSRLGKEAPESKELLFYLDTTGKKRRRESAGESRCVEGAEEDPEDSEMKPADSNRANRAQQEMYQRQRQSEGGTPRAKAPATPMGDVGKDDTDTVSRSSKHAEGRSAKTPMRSSSRRPYQVQAEVPSVNFRDLGGIEQILQVCRSTTSRHTHGAFQAHTLSKYSAHRADPHLHLKAYTDPPCLFFYRSTQCFRADKRFE